MIEASLLGGLLGGVSRLAPELLKFFDKKGERKHEITMLEKSIEADKVRAESQLRLVDAQAAANQFTSALAALQESVKGQSSVTGNPLIDGVNMLVRPIVTYVVFAMWILVKLTALFNSGGDMTLAQTVAVWWSESDQAMLTYILNFWFLGRVFEKVLK